MHDAKTHLSRYVAELQEGETLLLCNRNAPVAELRRVETKPRKTPRFGLSKGQYEVPEAFFTPLPDDLEKAFRGE
jgi:antitoxin (DNA-binding transcriptional repressor) of toxin-antitoxin stability system